MISERLKERAITGVLVVVVVLALLLGVRASEWLRSQTVMTNEARVWMLQQRELMLRQAKQQGLLTQKELANGENGGTAETDGSGAPPRKPN